MWFCFNCYRFLSQDDLCLERMFVDFKCVYCGGKHLTLNRELNRARLMGISRQNIVFIAEKIKNKRLNNNG